MDVCAQQERPRPRYGEKKKRKEEEVRCEITSGRFRRVCSSCVVRYSPHNMIQTDNKTSGGRHQRLRRKSVDCAERHVQLHAATY